jgi:hypothetical protein
MDREEYFRNSCGITAKNIIPYIRTMDRTPRLSRRKTVYTPRPHEINGEPTPRLTTAEMNKVRDSIRSQKTKIPPIIPKLSLNSVAPSPKLRLPKLKLNSVVPAVDTNDKRIFDVLRDREARLSRIANSNTIQNAIEENKIFNYRYIKKLPQPN